MYYDNYNEKYSLKYRSLMTILKLYNVLVYYRKDSMIKID